MSSTSSDSVCELSLSSSAEGCQYDEEEDDGYDSDWHWGVECFLASDPDDGVTEVSEPATRNLNEIPGPIEVEEARLRGRERARCREALNQSIEAAFRNPSEIRRMLSLLPDVNPDNPVFTAFLESLQK